MSLRREYLVEAFMRDALETARIRNARARLDWAEAEAQKARNALAELLRAAAKKKMKTE